MRLPPGSLARRGTRQAALEGGNGRVILLDTDIDLDRSGELLGIFVTQGAGEFALRHFHQIRFTGDIARLDLVEPDHIPSLFVFRLENPFYEPVEREIWVREGETQLIEETLVELGAGQDQETP